ncbi:MAG: sigma-70 family RNA polymerase sigma factor [Candidatus Riflebacteria bacterium]|nr:sigma-70 family RNA polymerase sigma factor [Candidatus Riflebacteria bacterium]
MNKNQQIINQQFAGLIQQFQGLVYSIVYGITLDSVESWDLTQEVFVKAFSNANFTDAGFSQKAWLIRVARNEALKNRRSLMTRLRYLARFCGLENTSEAKELENSFIKDETVAKLKTLLEKLDDEDRQILTLRFSGELSYQEIAEEMQLKIGTVMSRLSRLKDRLGLALEEEPENAV